MTDERKKGKKKPTKKEEDSALFEMPSISTLMGRKKSKLSTVSEATRTAISKRAFMPAHGALELDIDGEDNKAEAENETSKSPDTTSETAINDSEKQPSLEKISFSQEIHIPQTAANLGTNMSDITLNDPSGSEVDDASLKPNDYAINKITIDAETSPKPIIKVKTARRNTPNNPDPELIEWKMKTLEKSKDPLARGLLEFIRAGAKQALFLIQSKNPESKMVPLFIYSAAFKPENKTTLWKGLRWDPRLVSDLWSQIIQKGFFELGPPEPSTIATSARNVTRGAFGLDSNQWLTVVTVGSKDACRGLLAVISDRSLSAVLPGAMVILQTKPKIPKKKNAA